MIIKGTTLILVATAILFSACKSEEGENPVPEPLNHAPESFEVIPAVAGNTVTVSWTAAADPDGDTVAYDVFLEGMAVAEDISTTSHTFADLHYEKTYVGKIIANDGNEGSSEIDFSFTTGYLFLKAYDQYGVQHPLEYSEGRLTAINGVPVNTGNKGRIIKIGDTYYTYTPDGLLNIISNRDGEMIIQYDIHNNIARMSGDFDNGDHYRLKRDFIYNDSDQLIQVNEEIRGSGVLKYTRFNLQYDDEGNVVQVKTGHSDDNVSFTFTRTETYAYDDKKNPWFTLLSGQTSYNAFHILRRDNFHATFKVGTNGTLFRVYWMSKNNVTSRRIETASFTIDYNLTYAYNDYSYPVSAEINKTSTADPPSTLYERYYY